MNKGLILDYKKPLDKPPYIDEWVQFKNLKEMKEWFQAFLETNNCDVATSNFPEIISFGHDLVLEHTAAESIRPIGSPIFYSKFKEPTGLQCAEWFTQWADKHEVTPKRLCVHTENPMGQARILDHLNNWKRSKGLSPDCFTFKWKFE